MAKELVDRVVEWLHDRGDAALEGRTIKPCRTKTRPLPGAQGLEPHGQRGIEAIAELLARNAGVDGRIAEHLAQTYGQRAASVAVRGLKEPALLERIAADLPYIWAEIDHAFEADLARTVEDVLVRRVPLALRGREQGLDVAPRVAARMGLAAEEAARQLATYERYVAATRRFRPAPPARAAGG